MGTTGPASKAPDGKPYGTRFPVITIADNRDKRLIETAQEGGETKAVVEGQRDILNQVERANNAEQEIQRSGDVARYDRCLLNATDDTRANCERFRPVSD